MKFRINLDEISMKFRQKLEHTREKNQKKIREQGKIQRNFDLKLD